MSKFTKNNKVAIITGASGGIGKAVAKQLHAEGAIIVATDLHQAPLDMLAEELGHDRILPLELDVTDTEMLEHVRSEVLEKYGRIDFVFANAGIACDPPMTIRSMPSSTFEKIVEVDTYGVTRTVKTFLEDIISVQGHILVTSSVYSFSNGVLNAPYAASKAAVEMYTRALRAELAGTGATAGVLYPGWVTTGITKSVEGGHQLATTLRNRFFKGPFGRFITPDVLAKDVSTGISNRSARIFSPKRWAPMSAIRGFLSYVSDKYLDKDVFIHNALRQIESETK